MVLRLQDVRQNPFGLNFQLAGISTLKSVEVKGMHLGEAIWSVVLVLEYHGEDLFQEEVLFAAASADLQFEAVPQRSEGVKEAGQLCFVGHFRQTITNHESEQTVQTVLFGTAISKTCIKML